MNIIKVNCIFGNFSLMTLSELHVCVDCNACCGSYVTQRQLCKPGSQSLHWPGAAPSGTLSLSVDIPQERGLGGVCMGN